MLARTETEDKEVNKKTGDKVTKEGNLIRTNENQLHVSTRM